MWSYRLEMEKKTARLGDQQLSVFVDSLFRKGGGKHLLENIRWFCSDMAVHICGSEQSLLVAHLSLFFCENYKEMPCRFVSIPESDMKRFNEGEYNFAS